MARLEKALPFRREWRRTFGARIRNHPRPRPHGPHGRGCQSGAPSALGAWASGAKRRRQGSPARKRGVDAQEPPPSAGGAPLGACPRIRRGRVPGAAGADARRRDAGDAGTCRGAATTQTPPRRREPEGRMGVARRSRRSSSSTMAPTSPPPRALRSPRKPHARDPSYYSDRLLGSLGTLSRATRLCGW